MKLRKPIQRSQLKRKPRKPSETLRIYGPPARRKWMNHSSALLCAPLSSDHPAVSGRLFHYYSPRIVYK